jgi:hypothetical protein
MTQQAMSERSMKLQKVATTPNPAVDELCGNVLSEAEANKAERVARLTSSEEFVPDEIDVNGNIS